MNICDFSDMINRKLVITRHPNQNSRFTAEFECCEVQNGIFLAGTYGEGVDPIQAINDYKNKLNGKKIVFNATSSNNRSNYTVPNMVDYHA